MCKNCKIVTKNIVKENKKDLIEAFDKIRDDHKEEFGKGVNGNIVGSARRNMIFQKGDSDWDIDFQIKINVELLENKLGNTQNIKKWFIDKFKNYLPEYYVSDSTSVITLNLELSNDDGFKSYDIAILSTHPETKNTQILKHVKKDDRYIWNELKDSREIFSEWKNIKNGDWTILKEFYKSKKCENFDLSEEQKTPSSEILMSSINHVIQTKK